MPDKVITPTPAEIDAIGRELEELQAIADEASEAVKAKKDELLPLITRHGHAPDGTAKSLRLEGHIYALTATFGQSTTVVKRNVEKLFAQLKEEKSGKLFDKLFLADMDYIVAPEALSWAQRLSAKARSIFDACVKTSQRKPSVKCDHIVAEPAEKKAKKAKAATA